MKKLVLILCLWCNLAYAGGAQLMPVAYNHTSYGPPGHGYDYTNLQAWNIGKAVNCVTNQKGEMLYVYPGTYNDQVIISGATVNASYFRGIMAVPGSERVPIFSSTSTAPNVYTIESTEQYFGIYNLILRKSNTDQTHSAQCVAFTANYCKLVGCILDLTYNANITAPASYAVNVYLCTGYIVNDVILNSSAYSGAAGYLVDASGVTAVAYVYNCLIGTGSYGLAGLTSGVIYAKNDIVRNVAVTTTGTVNQTTCAMTTGAGTVKFAADGHHLSFADSTARDKGTSLSADAVFPFNDDMDKLYRPGGSAWDIGPGELHPAASVFSIF